MNHHLKKIQHKKMFFINSFIVSIVFMVIVCIVLTLGHNFFADMAYRFCNIEQDDFAIIVGNASMIWKVLIIQFTLIPSLAMILLEKHVREDELID